VALGAHTGFAMMTAPLHVPLPPGVFFYTFESMSYAIDIYKDEFRAEHLILLRQKLVSSG
jgi:alginate O-acetyltransferase complex protein AlgI